jgi:hypothetical protein
MIGAAAFYRCLRLIGQRRVLSDLLCAVAATAALMNDKLDFEQSTGLNVAGCGNLSGDVSSAVCTACGGSGSRPMLWLPTCSVDGSSPAQLCLLPII